MSEAISHRLLLERVLKEWQVDRKQRRALLALGEAGAEGLVALAEKLAILLPHNALMAALWPTTPMPQFDDLSPLDYIIAHGQPGLDQVRTFVEQG